MSGGGPISRQRGSNRRAQPGASFLESAGLLVVVVGVLLVVGAVYSAAHLGHLIAGLDPAPADPWAVLFGVLDGSVAWPAASTLVLAVIALVAALASAGLWQARRRRASRSSRVDWTSSYLGRGREVEGIRAKTVRQTAGRLNVTSHLPGLPIGRSVATGETLYGSWEDTHLLLAGPRTGKTTAFAVPAILDAPGAVIVTSNKRDLVDATRDLRAAAGPVWVFDPQKVTGEEPTWWWNPLSYVTDETKAATLADHFDAGSRALGSRTDAFFDPKGRDLLADLFLAAALDQRPITDVYRWLTRPTNDEAARILAAHGYPLQSDRVAGVIHSPEKQRGGVYGAAERMATCLTSTTIQPWVTEDTSGWTRRRHFDPHTFVADGGTLYSLSKEGRGNVGPLVTALTVAVVEAAQEQATRSAGGRLPVPLVGVLDEAANVCRWRDLPDLYSFFGSHGIILMTILQSWSQGKDVWGDSGMNKLWSAANIRTYAGGIAEEEFLAKLSRLVGRYDQITRSTSTRAGAGGVFGSGVQTSRQLQRELIFDVDDLAALPKGRALVLSSGNRPTLVATMPWMDGPHAEAIRASITAHDPQRGPAGTPTPRRTS